MKKIYDWISCNRLIGCVIAFIYYLLIVLPHEQVGLAVVYLFKTKSRSFYQNTMMISGVLLLVILVAFLIPKIIGHPYRKRILTGMAITLGLMMASFKLLLVHNVEMIHFAQYFSLCLFIYPLVRNLNRTFIISTLAGFFDELYQYLILAPQRTDYFDFNDIFLNELGAALGVLFLFSIGFSTIYRPKWYHTSEFFVFAAIFLSLVLMYCIGEFSYFMPTDGTSPIFVLIKKEYPGFFTVISHLNVRFHVLKPLPGSLLITCTAIFYILLFGTERKKSDA